MGTSSPKMDRKIKALRNFKKYEDIFYSFLNKNYINPEEIAFFLVPKSYIITFCKTFSYLKNIKELINLNIYHDSPKENDENIIIEKDIIQKLTEENKDILFNNLKLHKINNNSIIDEKNGSDYSLKLNNEGLFIPLLYNIWDKLYRYYGCDLVLKRKGFTNKGELFILTEEKRIDCFIKDIKTRDIIYHFCFIIKDKNNIIKLKNYFKNNSAKDLLNLLKIKYVGNQYKPERFKKIIKIIPNHISLIGGFEITIYFLDSYIFKENREFESITFEVEKNLKKPNNFYDNENIDNIFKNIFKNESFEILMYNFNLDETKFYNFERKSLI